MQLVANGHAIIGIIVISVLLVQPLLGIVAHWIYKKRDARNAHKRESRVTGFGVTHRWVGRVFLVLGESTKATDRIFTDALKVPSTVASVSNSPEILFLVRSPMVFLLGSFSSYGSLSLFGEICRQSARRLQIRLLSRSKVSTVQQICQHEYKMSAESVRSGRVRRSKYKDTPEAIP